MTKAEESKALINAHMKGGIGAVRKLKEKWRKEAAKEREQIKKGKTPIHSIRRNRHSTARKSSSDTAVSRTKENIDRGRTSALNTLITVVPGGFVLKAGRLAGKIFKTKKAAVEAAKKLKAPTPKPKLPAPKPKKAKSNIPDTPVRKLPAPKPAPPPVRSSKTTPSAATTAKNRLTRTPNTSTAKPPVRQTGTPSTAMKAQQARAARDIAAKKKREAIAEKLRLEAAAAKRAKLPRKLKAKTKTEEGRLADAWKAAVGPKPVRKMVDRTVKKPKVLAKPKKPKVPTKPSIGSIVGGGSKLPAIVGGGKQSPRPPAKKPTPPATRATPSPRPQATRPPPPKRKAGRGRPLAAVPTAVAGPPKPTPPKKRAKDEVYDTDLVAHSKLSPDVDDDFFDTPAGVTKKTKKKKSKKDPHWREIEKGTAFLTKLLGRKTKYEVPETDDFGVATDPDMREAELTSDAKGGLIGRPRKTTKVKIKKKATSSTKKRKGFGGRGHGAALRGF
jgi:hypothetical protein